MKFFIAQSTLLKHSLNQLKNYKPQQFFKNQIWILILVIILIDNPSNGQVLSSPAVFYGSVKNELGENLPVLARIYQEYPLNSGNYIEMYVNLFPDGNYHFQLDTILTHVNQQDLQIPEYFALSAYPNTFNPSTNLRVSIKTPGTYSIRIY